MADEGIHYFAGGNTARGFYSLFDSSLAGLERIFILKGGPGSGKSTLMKEIGEEWLTQGYGVQFIHCSLDPESLDGVIIPNLNVGIVDGTAPHVIEPKMPGAVEEYVNLGEAWDTEELARRKDEISGLTDEITNGIRHAYDTFAEALRVHDDWEKIYIEKMDFVKANLLTDSVIDTFFKKMELTKQSDVRHRFLGAATSKGAVDFVQNLTGVHKRYFIKGRPGSGKSTMLKKIAAEGERRGFDLEIYHCGFDPNSLDMVIIRELGLAIFDSTAPHEYFPSRDNDEVLDMYEILIEAGTDELFAEEIETVRIQYKEKMAEAIGYLAEAKALHDELESIYTAATDFSIVEKYKDQIRGEILRRGEK
ncbi:PRK06851 family protein [Bacillus benzoevorans]|uniref:PRK06851 family protein n=1 Tax=Bacillus benzoevorans TaxID=1456 RepID=UPI00161B6A38|nr:PRK06851 family protein [Bacillus benzoevorans]